MAAIIEANSETKLLLRSLKPEIFRLIIVQHNHKWVIDWVVEQIQQTYPERSVKRLQLEHKNYRELTEAIYQQRTGILIIEDFHKVLDKPEVYVGLNQRRDKIAQYPLALICFIPIGDKVLQECMRKLPDFWSFRNLLVKLEQEQVPEYSIRQEANKEFSTIGGDTIYEKEKELNRLIARIEELQVNPENIPLINTYYPQILQLLEETGNYQRGLEYAERFVKLAEVNHYSQNIPSVYSDALDWQAKFFQYLGQYEQAKALFEKALVSDIDNFGNKHPNVALRQSNLALVYKDLGQYENARALLKKALESDIQNYGEKHPTVATRQSNLALVCKNLGLYQQAKELMEKALDSAIKHYGEKHPTVATRQSGLATVYRALGENEKARDLLLKALASAITHYGEKHPIVAIRQSNLAFAYKSLGQFETARDLLLKALASAITHYGEKHPTVAINQSNLAMVYRDLGQYEKAKELGKRAYATFLHTLGEHHPNTQTVKSFLDQIDSK